jgi:hypothetical protein
MLHASLWLGLGLIFDREDGGDMCSKNSATLTALHGVRSQKINSILVTAVRTSNPASCKGVSGRFKCTWI